MEGTARVGQRRQMAALGLLRSVGRPPQSHRTNGIAGNVSGRNLPIGRGNQETRASPDNGSIPAGPWRAGVAVICNISRPGFVSVVVAHGLQTFGVGPKSCRASDGGQNARRLSDRVDVGAVVMIGAGHRIGRSLQRTWHQIAAASVQWNAFRPPSPLTAVPAVQSISLQPASARFCNFDCFDQLSIFSGSAPERLGNSSVSERTKAFAACA